MRALLALVLLLPALAWAQTSAPPRAGAQISLVAGSFRPASAHGAQTLSGGGLVLGYDFASTWSLEGLLAQTAREDGAGRMAVLSALSVRYHPWQSGPWRPELFVEAGRTGFLDAANLATRYNVAGGGLGLKWFAPSTWFARADLHAQHNPGGTDYALWVGGGIYFTPRSAPVRTSYDSDGDGLSDDRDTELNVVAPAACTACAAPPRRDPCQSDDDLDGITDCKDACPATPAGEQIGPTGCPLPQCRDSDPDTDSDGVPDCRDACPRSASGLKTDAHGCVVMAQFPVTVSLDVKFEFNRSEILELFNVELSRFRQLLLEHPELEMELEGHADAIGGDAYNLKLSEQRARAVRAWLLANGEVDARRIRLRPYGKSHPIASNDTDEGRAQNRRVVATLSIAGPAAH